MRRFATCVLACALVAGAVEGSEISGFIDMSYNMNLDDQPANALRRYHDQVDMFVLNAAHLVLGGGFDGGARYTIELDIGYNNSVETGWFPEAVGLQEAYIDTEAGGRGLTIRAGKFEAISGMEGMDAPDNLCISRGLISSYGLPRTYTGVLLGFSEGSFDFGLGMVNGWDVFLDTEQSLLLTVGGELTGDIDFAASYLKGDEGGNERTTLDVVVSFNTSSGADIDIEYTSSSEVGGGNDEWSALGIQASMSPSDSLLVGIRYESFDDPDNARIPVGPAGTFTSITVMSAFELSTNSTLRLEFRIDTAETAVFAGSDTQKTFALQLLSTF